MATPLNKQNNNNNISEMATYASLLKLDYLGKEISVFPL